MVKVWIHKPGGTEPFLAEEITLQDCLTQFDLEQAKFLQPLGARPPSPAAPGPLGQDRDAELVVFEVLADEQSGQIKPGYYASEMTADTVLQLIGGE